MEETPNSAKAVTASKTYGQFLQKCTKEKMCTLQRFKFDNEKKPSEDFMIIHVYRLFLIKSEENCCFILCFEHMK